MRIRAAEPGDRAELQSFLERWHSLRVARLGMLEHSMLVAERDGCLVGVLTYVVGGADCEFSRCTQTSAVRAWAAR